MDRFVDPEAIPKGRTPVGPLPSAAWRTTAFSILPLVMILLHSSMPDSFSIPEDLVGKLQTMAKKQRKTAEELLLEIVREYIEVQEFLQRKLSAKASQPKRPPKVL